MRALTADEVEALRLSGSGIRVGATGLRGAIYSCVALGRMRLVPCPTPERPNRWRTEVTDLGRLALRVALPFQGGP